MTDGEITQAILKVLRTIAPEAEFSELDPQENLREALDIDSFDFLNFIIGLHEDLGVEIPESDYRQLTTLSSTMRYLSNKLGSP